MLIEQIVESVKLSDAQQSVIDYILKERGNIKNQTIKEIAKVTYTSTGTIIRLAKKLGYHGFEDFKEDFLKEVHYMDTHFQNIDPNYPFTSQDNMQKISSKVTALAQETLSDTLSLIEHDSLQKAIRLLRNAKHIHLAAISYSLLLGQMFQLDMMRISMPGNRAPQWLCNHHPARLIWRLSHFPHFPAWCCQSALRKPLPRLPLINSSRCIPGCMPASCSRPCCPSDT